jgi:hypothetical protein
MEEAPEHLKDASLKQALALPANIGLVWECLPGINILVITKVINYAYIMLCSIGSRGQFYETLSCCN